MRMHQQRITIDQHMKLPHAGLAQQNVARRARRILGHPVQTAHRRPAVEPVEAAAAQPVVAWRIDAAPDPFERRRDQPDAIETRGRIAPVQTEGAADQIKRGGGEPVSVVHVRRSQTG